MAHLGIADAAFEVRMKPAFARRVKIVATLGPASDGLERDLVAAGLDVARLNFSHGTLEEHARRCSAIRDAAKAFNRSVAVMQDLQGPKIRIGGLAGGGPVVLEVGELLTIVPYDVEGTAERVSSTYAGLPTDVKPGDQIWLDDGRLRLRVLSTSDAGVVTRVEVGGPLGEHKGINLPGVAVSAPALTEADREHLRFGVTELNVDYIALSFVRSVHDVVEARNLIQELGGDAEVVAKLERAEAITRLNDIMDAADAVMVARGDLGIELGPEHVPALQKTIIQRANARRMPVIVATQMLESMTVDEIPTRAEASDVANAVWDGTDAVMLSGETAAGRHPRLVVDMMDRIIRSAESASQQPGFTSRRAARAPGRSPAAAVTEAACILANDVQARAIVGLTGTGRTAQMLSSRRAAAPILAFGPNERVCNRLALWWGVTPVHHPMSPDLEESIPAMEAHLLSSGFAEAGDPIVVTGAHPFKPGTQTNFIKYQRVAGPHSRLSRFVS